MKRKWPIVLAAVLIAAGVGIFSFRDALMIRLFPKIVLSKAIAGIFQQLDERYENSPIHVLTGALDLDGSQQISMKLDTTTQFMGVAHYDLQLNTQIAPNRILGTGTVSTGSGMMDLSLFLDENFAAVSSDGLTEGSYYGLTYDTFSHDIRGFLLISFLAGEEMLNSWDASVTGLADMMRRSYTLPELQSEDIRTVLMGALALKPTVTAGEKGRYMVTFQAEGEEIAEAAEHYMAQVPEALASLIHAMEEDDNSQANIVFRLQGNQLTEIDAGITMEKASYQVSAELLGDGELVLELFFHDAENLKRAEIAVKTASDTDVYHEIIKLKYTVNGVQSQLSMDYSWALSSGDMVLNLTHDGQKQTIRLNLTGEGESFTVSCQEFEKFIGLLSEKENPRPTICTMTVSPGESITHVPAYRNLSDWSMEDFMLLIARLGGLIGLKLP